MVYLVSGLRILTFSISNTHLLKTSADENVTETIALYKDMERGLFVLQAVAGLQTKNCAETENKKSSEEL